VSRPSTCDAMNQKGELAQLPEILNSGVVLAL
jgi:hypothetical protein